MSVFVSDFILQAELFSVHSLVSSISAPFGTPYTQGSFLAHLIFHDWIPASELPRKPEVSGGIWTAVQSWTLLLHCISYGIISPCVFTLCSQELGVKWLCKQVWQFQGACVFVQKPFPGDWLLILASEKCKGGLYIVHTENPATLRGLCNICFEVECF